MVRRGISTADEASPPRGRGNRGRATSRGGAKRARVGSSSASIASVPGYEHITFSTQAQRDRFIILQGMTMNPTRFLCISTLEKLGLDAIMMELFNGTGCRALFGMQALTYRSLTLEFLSSFNMHKDTDVITFRVHNEDYSLSLNDFGNHFSLARSPIHKAPDTFSVATLWRCISDTHIRGFSNVRVNNIQHPAIRLWFRTVIGTFFGRSEVGTLNYTEASILGSYLNVQGRPRFTLDLPYLVAKHMLDVAENRIKSIEIGGLITHLVHRMGILSSDDFDELNPIDVEVRWIDRANLRTAHHWLKVVNHGYQWRVTKSPERFMTLPCTRLPPLVPLGEARPGAPWIAPSYLIPENIDDMNLDEVAPLRLAAGPSTSVPQPPPHPTQHDICIAKLDFMNQRFLHHAVNQNLESYWRYHQDVLNDIALPPHPTYYRGADTSGVFEEAGIDPNVWNRDYHRSYGGFGGQFLDEFGRLNVGGGGHDGEDDDDE